MTYEQRALAALKDADKITAETEADISLFYYVTAVVCALLAIAIAVENATGGDRG